MGRRPPAPDRASGAPSPACWGPRGARRRRCGSRHRGQRGKTADLITQDGGRAAGYQADVSQAAEIDRAVQRRGWATWGPLHIMVNKRRHSRRLFSNVDETEEDLWRRVIDIDLTGVFLGCKTRPARHVCPRARAASSTWPSVGGSSTAPAAARPISPAKHGVVGLTRQMAVVYSKRGITVNCVCPGPIPTNFARAFAGAARPQCPRHSKPRRSGQ